MVKAAFIATRRQEDLVVVTLLVDIDLGNAEGFHHELSNALAGDVRGMAIDLGGTRYVDSAGIQVLFDMARQLEIARQRLGIVVPADSPLQRLVKTVRLDEIAVVSSTVDDCLAALAV